MRRRFLAISCLFIFGLTLGGCGKCGWLGDEGPRACRADAPR